MTLRELMVKCRYKPTFNAIQQIFYKKASRTKTLEADIAFLGAWSELESLSPRKNTEWKINFQERSLDDQEVIDVCWYSIEADELYALDFVDWHELIDAEIEHSVALFPREILAYILWEITFWGFSRNQIKGESLKLSRDVGKN